LQQAPVFQQRNINKQEKVLNQTLETEFPFLPAPSFTFRYDFYHFIRLMFLFFGKIARADGMKVYSFS